MCQKQRCRMPSVKCARPAVVWVLSRREGNSTLGTVKPRYSDAIKVPDPL